MGVPSYILVLRSAARVFGRAKQETLPCLQQLDSPEQEVDLIESYIKAKAVNGVPLRILEAGCGQRWPLKLSGVNFVLTGIDLDKKALEIRKNVAGDLDEGIAGDLCSIDLGEKHFDVIYNSFVLEHVEHADRALSNFSKWSRPGTLVVLKIPDPHSVRGFITRVTPHWFHVFYYRYVLGAKNAGKPGYAPYATYYHPVVSRTGIRRFCQDNNFTVCEERGDGGYQPFGKGAVALATRLIVHAVHALSFRRLTSKHTDLLYILEKTH